MKRSIKILIPVLGLLFLFSGLLELHAQVVKGKIEYMSPGRRSSGPPNYTAPPAGTPYYISPGLHVFGKGMKFYMSADTTGSGANAATSFTWTFLRKPTGSNATFDSTNNRFQSFTADSTGSYSVVVTVNGGAADTIDCLASTYVGASTVFPGCAMSGCHNTKVADWKETKHSSIFARGISGQLEIDPLTGKGVYSTNCIKCHTTGWEPTVNNGNYGFLAKLTGFDTTWYKTFEFVNGEYEIHAKDSTALNLMGTTYSQVAPTATIGCESCHGPGANHLGDKTKIGKSLEAGVCLQCHDAPKKHRLGSYWMASGHAKMSKGHASSTTCYPCHSGSAFTKWLDNKTTPGWSIAEDGTNSISCSVCHDPHGGPNPNQLRTVSVDSLRNGYIVPAGLGGKGQLCMNCHNSRYSAAKRVTNTPPYYGFVNHYGPHGNPQTDMLLGRNAYQYGDTSLTGLSTHTGLKDACVTCHMQTRTNGSSVHANHEWNMSDSTGDYVGICATCHGPITSFEDIKASYDYDRNGKIEGVEIEIEGMLAKLKAQLPLNATTGEPTDNIADSLLVKDHPELVQNLYTYLFITSDGSKGMHNTKYAVALLQKALGWYPLDVRQTNNGVPTEFALAQNYPNPFNPTTTIKFAVKEAGPVMIEVYDMLGSRVRTLVARAVAPGNFQVEWAGDNDRGVKVPSGVYLYRMQSGAFSATKKMILMK